MQTVPRSLFHLWRGTIFNTLVEQQTGHYIIKKVPAVTPATKRFKVNHNKCSGKGTLSGKRASQKEGDVIFLREGDD